MTYSIVAHDHGTGQMGVAVQSSAGGLTAEGVAVQGNILARGNVCSAMLDAYDAAEGELRDAAP